MKTKEIQCSRCSAWHSVSEWNGVAGHNIEDHDDRYLFYFRCPTCGRNNNFSFVANRSERYRKPYDGSTDTHPGEIALQNADKVVRQKMKSSDMFANVLMLRAKEQAELREEIEQALARGDRKAFMKLTKKYKEESEKPVPLGGVECG